MKLIQKYLQSSVNILPIQVFYPTEISIKNMFSIIGYYNEIIWEENSYTSNFLKYIKC